MKTALTISALTMVFMAAYSALTFDLMNVALSVVSLPFLFVIYVLIETVENAPEK